MLLRRVAELLRDRGTPFALIGAAAMAVHGVTRSTRDLDLLVSDPSSLDPSYWQALQNEDIDVSVRAGAPDDPLAGVIRLRTAGETVDVIVARPAWQREVPRRATITEIDGVPVPVARRADLVLLKLYAGGPQDAWDIGATPRGHGCRGTDRGGGCARRRSPGRCPDPVAATPPEAGVSARPAC